MSKGFNKLDDNYNLLHKKINAIANATTRLIDDITAFNMDYLKDLKVKSEKDDKVFEKVEDFLSNFKETMSKVNLSSQSSISQDSIYSMVLSIETSIKEELALILNMVLRLPINAPHFMHVSQGGERCVLSSKRSGEDTM